MIAPVFYLHVLYSFTPMFWESSISEHFKNFKQSNEGLS